MNNTTPQLQLVPFDTATRRDRPRADAASPATRPVTSFVAKSDGPRARWRVSRLPAGGASQREARDKAASDDVRWAPLVALPDLLIPILLTSATDADRALFARRLHDLGGRRDGPFVTVHCWGHTPEEIDLALFGDDSWNAAAEGVIDGGAVVAATGGTLYVEEISHLSLRTQAKLLHAIERRRHPSVVTQEERPLNFRLIAATTADLRREVRYGRFRAGLLFAISGFALWVPPLAPHPERSVPRSPELSPSAVYMR